MDESTGGSGWALLPVLVFMVVYLLSSLIARDFASGDRGRQVAMPSIPDRACIE
jgi:hypothetical protein